MAAWAALAPLLLSIIMLSTATATAAVRELRCDSASGMRELLLAAMATAEPVVLRNAAGCLGTPLPSHDAVQLPSSSRPDRVCWTGWPTGTPWTSEAIVAAFGDGVSVCVRVCVCATGSA
jgi:hypothetical protein